MKKGVVIFLLLAVAAVVSADSNSKAYRSQFSTFKATYKRHYSSASEEEYRFTVFVANVLAAAGMRVTNPLATFGVNAFSDLTPEEFKKTHHSAQEFYRQRANMTKSYMLVQPRLAAGNLSVDWRQRGAVTYVRDQGYCGGCWSFAAAGNIEGSYFIKTGKLVALSEQQLISCDTMDSGCDGGLEYNAWNWLLAKRSGQIFTEASYPYTSGNGKVAACNNNNRVVGAVINGYKNIKPNETEMANYMFSGGPVSVGVDATSWQSYTGGILTNCISRAMDHSVLAVGFNDSYTPPYWIVKNSWGTSWGEAGYIRVAKGSNQCLIANDPSTSTA